MSSLDDDLGQLVERLKERRSLLGNAADPFYYFAYEPSAALEVRRRLPAVEGAVRNAGLDVIRVSFADLLWELVDASGRWELWLEAEADFDPAQVNDAIRDVLAQGDAMVERVGAILAAAQPGSVVFLTETEALHPYFRARTLESRLHDRVKVPVVVFYPGRRVGQYGLRFLDLYPEDSNYRATIIGGLP